MTAAIQFNVDAALAKLGEMAQAHGTQALDVAIQVERIGGINNLVGAVALLAVAVVLGLVARWCFQVSCKIDMIDNPAPGFCAVVASLVCAGLFFVGFLPTIVNGWNWIAIFNPKLALAHDLMMRLAGIGQ